MKKTTFSRRIAYGSMAVAMVVTVGSQAAAAQTLAQYMRAERLKEERAARDAERKSKLPHAVSAAHQGTLTPVNDLATVLPGKTLYLQTPIVQNGQTQRVEVAPIYFASSGQAFSSQWAARPWQINGSSICIATGQQSSCMTALSDSANQAYLLGPTHLLVQIDRIEMGDSDNVKEAYQRTQEAQRKAGEAMWSLLGPVLIAALTSGGGGGKTTTTQYLYGPSGGSSGGGSGYTAPMGGETGLYGSCHSVGC